MCGLVNNVLYLPISGIAVGSFIAAAVLAIVVGVVILIVFIVVRQRNKVDDANVSSNALKPKESG